MRNKFGYCCSIKICASRYNELLESIFGILLAVEAFSLQKVVEMLEQVIAGWVNMAGEAKLHSPILSSFEALVVWPAVRCCWAEQLGPFCWLVQATGVAVFGASHQFAEHTSQMLWFQWDSESYRGSDGQQTTKQWPWPFFWCKFGFTKCFGASFQFNHWAGHNWLLHHLSLYLTIQSKIVHCCYINKRRWHFKTTVFLVDSQLMRHPLIKLFHLSNLLQIPNHYEVLYAEFFGNFLCTCKKFSSDDGSQSLSASDGWSLCSSSSRLSYRTSWTTAALYLVSSSWAKCIVDVVSCLLCFTTHFEQK